MAKKRVSIYIEGDTWDHIKNEAWRLRTSASALLTSIIRGETKLAGTVSVAEVKSKVGETLEELGGSQVELDKKRKGRDIKKERIRSLTGFSGSFSKSRQLNKR